MRLTLTDQTDARRGLPDAMLRDLVREKSAANLAGFVLRSLKGDKASRRKVIAWLIAEEPSSIQDEMAQEELLLWVEDVFVQKTLMPRTPKLPDLGPVKAAVRARPSLAVPVHIAIANEITDFLSAYGGGPQSLYSAYLTSFREAARNVALLADPQVQRACLDELEEMATEVSEFGYGMDAAAEECLDDLRDRLAGTVVETRGPKRRTGRR